MIWNAHVCQHVFTLHWPVLWWMTVVHWEKYLPGNLATFEYTLERRLGRELGVQQDWQYCSSWSLFPAFLFAQRPRQWEIHIICQIGASDKEEIKHLIGKKQTLWFQLGQILPIKHSDPQTDRLPILNTLDLNTCRKNTFNHAKDILWHPCVQWKITSKSNLTVGHSVKITSFFGWGAYYFSPILNTRVMCLVHGPQAFSCCLSTSWCI